MFKAFLKILRKFLGNKKGISEVLSEALLIAAAISLFVIAILNPISQIAEWLGGIWGGLNQTAGSVSEGLGWIIDQIKSMFGF